MAADQHGADGAGSGGGVIGRVAASAEWRFLAALRGSAPGLATVFWALVVVRGLLPAAFALVMGATVSAVQRGAGVGRELGALAVVFVLTQAVGPVHSALSTDLGARLSNWLHERLLDACLTPQGLAHLEDSGLADRLGGARDFDRGFSGPDLKTSMPMIATGFSITLGGLAQALLLFAYGWWAPVLLAGAWISTHHFLKQGAVWRQRNDPDVQEMQRRADYAYRLNVQPPAAKEVRLFGLSDWVIGGFKSLRRELLERSWEGRRLSWRPVRTAIGVVVMANAVVFWQLALDAASGRVGAGALVVFAQAAIGTSALAFSEYDWWFRSSAQPIPVVLDLAPAMGDSGVLPPASSSSRAVDLAAAPVEGIRLRDLHFAYPTSSEPVFSGVDLTIPAGRSLAIVGQNGAGKTTLAKLLCRFYDPTHGAVEVDGTDLRDLDVVAWRRRVAAVFQDFVRYELPLRDNVLPGLTGGAPDPDLDRLAEAALADANGTGLAMLDQPLSKAYEGGTDLSGGQWQRVAIARALAAVRAGAGIVLLDEPTAHLDVRAEQEIFDRVLDATRGVTTILISHRFATVRRADLICVLEHGRVIEVGTHDELMAQGGRYRTMFDMQAARFA